MPAHDGAFFQRLERVPPHLVGFLFHHRAAIDDDIFVIDIELDDAASDLLTDQLFHLRRVADAAARSRHERARSRHPR